MVKQFQSPRWVEQNLNIDPVELVLHSLPFTMCL